DMVNRYNYAAAGDDRIEHSPHLDRLVAASVPQEPPPPKPKLGIPPPYKRIDRNVYLAVALVAALAAVSWWAIQHKRDARADAELRVEPRPQVLSVPRSKVATPAPVPQTTSTAPAAPPQPLHLLLELTDDSWVTLLVDGKTVVNDDMHAGERRSFDATDEFRFKTVGNGAAVTVTIDNLQVPPLGKDGQVVHNRVFNRASLQKLAETESRGNP
ncbi:MAG: DUF4115 domain-containing protein, partial [Thermoanaerobaculia bacterium]